MAQFNQYNLYCYAAGNIKTACDDKILVDLHKLEQLKKYSEIANFVETNFGTVNERRTFEYPNDIKVLVIKEEKAILVYASQGEKRLFGKCWSKSEE